MADAEKEISALLRERHHLQPHQDDDFSIRNLEEVLAIKESAARAWLSWLLPSPRCRSWSAASAS